MRLHFLLGLKLMFLLKKNPKPNSVIMIHIHLLDLFKAEYKKGRGEMNKEPAVLGRPDFEHAKGVSKLLSQVSFSVILQ